jgi:hypothetical protein
MSSCAKLLVSLSKRVDLTGALEPGLMSALIRYITSSAADTAVVLPCLSALSAIASLSQGVEHARTESTPRKSGCVRWFRCRRVVVCISLSLSDVRVCVCVCTRARARALRSCWSNRSAAVNRQPGYGRRCGVP